MGKNGCRNHTFHPRHGDETILPALKCRELSTEGRKLVDTLRTAGLSYNATASAFQRSYGRTLTRSQIKYMAQSTTYHIQPCGHSTKQEWKTTSADWGGGAF